MRINVLSCSGTSGGERFMQELASSVEVDLMRLDGRITNVDVLLLDDEPDTAEAKGCVMEARIHGWAPIAVQARAHSFEKAVHVGAEKIEQVVEAKLDELEALVERPESD